MYLINIIVTIMIEKYKKIEGLNWEEIEEECNMPLSFEQREDDFNSRFNPKEESNSIYKNRYSPFGIM